jgi:hypothetical protein
LDFSTIYRFKPEDTNDEQENRISRFRHPRLLILCTNVMDLLRLECVRDNLVAKDRILKIAELE